MLNLPLSQNARYCNRAKSHMKAQLHFQISPVWYIIGMVKQSVPSIPTDTTVVYVTLFHENELQESQLPQSFKHLPASSCPFPSTWKTCSLQDTPKVTQTLLQLAA